VAGLLHENVFSGPDIHRGVRGLLCRERDVRALLRKTLKLMENLIVGAIALLLFLYLFAAMIRPEKF
jgi:K+-transporting ATPase KdpF subunit